MLCVACCLLFPGCKVLFAVCGVLVPAVCCDLFCCLSVVRDVACVSV